MLKVTEEYDFDALYNNSWGQAVKVLNEIDEHDKSEELIDFLEGLYPDGIDGVELNDLLAYDWEWVYKNIGMPIKGDE
nr:MAG TPA: hypothetical protein [Caudoviricetes sp.]